MSHIGTCNENHYHRVKQLFMTCKTIFAKSIAMNVALQTSWDRAK